MNDERDDNAGAVAPAPGVAPAAPSAPVSVAPVAAAAAPAPAVEEADPLAIFEAPPTEGDGIMVDVEHPTTGKVLMRWRLARFGGSNNAKIIRVDRQLKAKLTQGQRRAIDAGTGDPDIVARMNRQTFVRVSVLGFEMVDEKLKERYPTYSTEVADEILEAYPKLYDVLSEQAVDEERFAEAALADDLKN